MSDGQIDICVSEQQAVAQQGVHGANPFEIVSFVGEKSKPRGKRDNGIFEEPGWYEARGSK